MPAAGPEPEIGIIHMEDFVTAMRYLPPGAAGVAWADVDALRDGPTGKLLEGLASSGHVPAGPGARFVEDNIGRIHRAAGGVFLTMTGQAILVVLETDIDIAEMFEQVEKWAEARGVEAKQMKVRGRPALRTGDQLMVAAGGGTYINGTSGLAGRVLDLADRKVTGNALSPETAYLAQETIADEAVLVVSGIAPPSASPWLEAKHLPSAVGARFLASASAPSQIEMRLGLLSGKPIKPIWFAQEVNVFLVRAAEDQGVMDLGIDDWVKTLEVELLSDGIVVRGAMDPDRLLELMESMGGDE